MHICRSMLAYIQRLEKDATRPILTHLFLCDKASPCTWSLCVLDWHGTQQLTVMFLSLNPQSARVRAMCFHT